MPCQLDLFCLEIKRIRGCVQTLQGLRKTWGALTVYLALTELKDL